MVKLLSLFTAAVLGIASVTATLIYTYEGNLLDLIHRSAPDFSVVNSHFLTNTVLLNWTLIPAGNATIIQNVYSGSYLSYGPLHNLGYAQLVVQKNRPILLSIQSFNSTHSFILDTSGTYALTAWPSVSGLPYPPVTFEKLSRISPISNQLWNFQ